MTKSQSHFQETCGASSFDGAPSFNHPELIRNLYEYDVDIAPNIIREILALPRESLLDDLAAILDDADKRFDFFVENERKPNGGRFPHTMRNFPFHAICLLAEIVSDRSVDLVLGFLISKNHAPDANKDFIEFWLGEHITETIWQILFRLGRGREQDLVSFFFEDNIDIYTKQVAPSALTQIALRFPEQRGAILALFEGIFRRFIAMESDGAKIDRTMVAMALSDYADLAPEPVSPLARQLYERNLVDIRYSGKYEKLMEYGRRAFKNKLEEVPDIYKLYKTVFETWHSYNPQDGELSLEQRIESIRKTINKMEIDDEIAAKKNRVMEELLKPRPREIFQPRADPLIPSSQVAKIKVGRNDPCPCGSGKKYKKCCL